MITALVIWKPELFRQVPYGEQVLEYREQVLGATTSAQDLTGKLPQVEINELVDKIKEIKLPQNPFTGEPKAVKVEELIMVLTQELKGLPAEKAKEVKRNFCQDVITEANP